MNKWVNLVFAIFLGASCWAHVQQGNAAWAAFTAAGATMNFDTFLDKATGKW